MICTPVLIAAAFVSTSVMAVLPSAGGPYVIVNQETGLFWDDNSKVATNGNPILAFPFNNGGNQKLNLASNNTSGTSGNYTFKFVAPAVNIASGNAAAAGLTVQATPTTYTISEIGTDNSSTFYRIVLASVPTLAVTAADNRDGQLTLRALNATNRFQHWRIFQTSAI